MVRGAQAHGPAEDPLHPLEALGRLGRLRPEDGGIDVREVERKTGMIDATRLKEHRTASSLLGEKSDAGAWADAVSPENEHQAEGRPLRFFLTAGSP